MSKRRHQQGPYLIPSPMGFSKMIGSLRPPLWTNSYEKSEKHKIHIFWLSPPQSCNFPQLLPYKETSSNWSKWLDCMTVLAYLFPPCEWPCQSWTSDYWLSPPGQTSFSHQSPHLRCRHHGTGDGYRPAKEKGGQGEKKKNEKEKLAW